MSERGSNTQRLKHLRTRQKTQAQARQKEVLTQQRLKP